MWGEIAEALGWELYAGEGLPFEKPPSIFRGFTTQASLRPRLKTTLQL